MMNKATRKSIVADVKKAGSAYMSACTKIMGAVTEEDTLDSIFTELKDDIDKATRSILKGICSNWEVTKSMSFKVARTVAPAVKRDKEAFEALIKSQEYADAKSDSEKAGLILACGKSTGDSKSTGKGKSAGKGKDAKEVHDTAKVDALIVICEKIRTAENSADIDALIKGIKSL